MLPMLAAITTKKAAPIGAASLNHVCKTVCIAMASLVS